MMLIGRFYSSSMTAEKQQSPSMILSSYCPESVAGRLMSLAV